MKTWFHDTKEGFSHLFSFLSYSIGLDLILKELNESEQKGLIKTEVELRTGASAGAGARLVSSIPFSAMNCKI